MIDKREFTALRELLEEQVRDAAQQRGPIDWYAKHSRLPTVNQPQKVLEYNPRRRKYRIRLLTIGAGEEVLLQSEPVGVPSAGRQAGAVLDMDRREIDDRDPFCYKGEVWATAVAGVTISLSVEEWSIPDPEA